MLPYNAFELNSFIKINITSAACSPEIKSTESDIKEVQKL